MLRKLFVIPVLLLLAFPVGGCGTIAAISNIATAEIKNPVTPKMLDNAQKTLNVGIDSLNIYGNLCVKQRLDQTCWDVIEHIQVYVGQLRPLLANARKFVRNNYQVNARKAYDAVQALLSDIRRESLAKGVI